MMVYKI